MRGRPTILGKVAAALGWLAVSAARAAVTCNVSVTSMTVVYDPTVATTNVTAGSWTIACTRLPSDPGAFDWSLGADAGTNPAGGFNRATLGTRTYQYRPYRQTPYTNANRWRNTARTRFTGTINFRSSVTATDSGRFDVVVPARQTIQPAGTYLDVVTVFLRDASSGAVIDSGTFTVSIITSNACQISVPPGDVSFSYTSLQAAPAAASTVFGVRCTTALPYTLSLDATSGTLLGLTYTLSLSAPSGTGTGVTQTYSINGSIAGNQAGTCGTAVCTGSQIRTLTVAY
jgi:hypothetical protein